MKFVKKMEKEYRSFVDRQDRRKEFCKEDAPRYRSVANDNKGIERAFCATYEPLFANIKCSMTQCVDCGCVSNIFTKGYD